MTLSMWEQEKFERGRAEGFSDGRAKERKSIFDAMGPFMQEDGIPAEIVSKFKSYVLEAARA